jgi:hypothetical protein
MRLSVFGGFREHNGKTTKNSDQFIGSYMGKSRVSVGCNLLPKVEINVAEWEFSLVRF